MIHLATLLDDEKCFEAVRALRWPDSVICPHCAAQSISKQGHDPTQRARQKYRCQICGRHFNDLTGTVFAGRHQPLQVWIGCLYLMGLNVSNRQIAQELDLNEDDVQRMTGQLRNGVVLTQPIPVLSGEVEADEVYVVTGHKGHPEAVKKRPHGPSAPAEGRPGARHAGEREAADPWSPSA